MRTKTLKVVRDTARWIQRILNVRLPVDAIFGIRTRR